MIINNYMKRFALLLVALFGLLSCEHAKPTDAGASKSQTSSYLAMETYSGRILFTGNPNERRPIGMLTNIATALVIVDWMEAANKKLDDMITVPESACKRQKTNLLGLAPGDRISLRDALHSCLMWDDSACAETLAYVCGSTIDPVNPEAAFVSQMNLMGKTIGMRTTNFKGSSGAVVTLSDTYDMAKLGMYAMLKPVIRSICSQRSYVVKVNGTRPVKITNSNTMISDSVDGVRAARSASAGCCLIVSSHRPGMKLRDPRTGQEATYPQRLLVVVLGAHSPQSRYKAASLMLQNGWNAWEEWQKTDDFTDPSKFIILSR